MRRHTIRTTKILAIAMTAAGCATSGAGQPATSASVTAEEAPLAVPIAAAQPVESGAYVQAVVETPEPAAKTASVVGAPPPATSAPVVEELTVEEIAEKEEAARTGPRSNEPALLVLRDELTKNYTTRRFDEEGNHLGALEPRYRALCDAAGYPLVGNVLRKSGGVSVTQLCRTVRRNMKASR